MPEVTGALREVGRAVFAPALAKLRVGSTSQSKSTNPYASEKVNSDRSWDYRTNNKVSLVEQADRQIRAIPGLGKLEATVIRFQGKKPSEADAMMAVPFLTDLGLNLGIPDPLTDGYGPLGETIFRGISANRSFYNYRKGQMSSQYVRMHAEVRERLHALETKPCEGVTGPEKGKLRFYSLPVSMGKYFAGYSPRNARHTALEADNLLPLGFVQIACLLLAWPERLAKCGQRWIDCSADEWDRGARGEWANCPVFSFRGGRLGFGARWSPDAHGGRYGSPVAFLGA